MEALLAGAEAKGLHVDAWDCAGPNNGRPKPWMSTSVAEKLDVYPLCACVKVDDTIPGSLAAASSGRSLACVRGTRVHMSTGVVMIMPVLAYSFAYLHHCVHA